MDFTPHTLQDIAKALETIGVDNIDALFADIPPALRNPDIDLPSGMDEASLMRHLRALAAKNHSPQHSFLGGGSQQHFIPSVTPHLAMQSEFVTAYTPYQPEVAQGVLQATFEYQTMMAELTGLAVSNASLYDGASSVAEAALLAVRHKKRNKVLVSAGVHPESREVLATYLRPLGIALETVPLEQLSTGDVSTLDQDSACLIVQNPNFLGYLEAMPRLAEQAHAQGALFVAVVDPLSLALLQAPGEYGADIAVGDGQTLGNMLNLGGPSFGFLVVDTPLLRQMPGRLVGQSRDVDGKRGFVLTLQAREQHIRRSKAKSNVCSNHQLTAIMAAINVAALGPQGLQDIAAASVQQAHSLAEQLAAAGYDVLTQPYFFNEFVLRVPKNAADVRHELALAGVHAGVPIPSAYGLGDAVLLAASELTRQDDIDALLAALAKVIGQPKATAPV